MPGVSIHEDIVAKFVDSCESALPIGWNKNLEAFWSLSVSL